MAIEVEAIDPFSLPYVSLSEKHLLPKAGGIYFVISGSLILYIGKAGNSLRERWVKHHRYQEFLAVSTTSEVVIAYWTTAPFPLVETEKALVEKLKPSLNKVFAPETKPGKWDDDNFTRLTPIERAYVIRQEALEMMEKTVREVARENPWTFTSAEVERFGDCKYKDVYWLILDLAGDWEYV